jgi:CBS domain containing-hemolysin-like protein
MSDLLFLAGLLLSTSASFYFSGIETGIYALNRVRLRIRKEDGRRRASRVHALVRRPQILISTILLGNHLANFAASFCSQEVVRRWFSLTEPELLNTVLLTPFLFVFGEITPKNVFRLRAETLVYRASGPLAVAVRIFTPLALAMRWLGRVSGALPRTSPSEDRMLGKDRLEVLVREVAEDGVLTADQSRMVRNVMRLSARLVDDVKIPLEDADLVEEGFTREELLSASRPNGRTRLPVRLAGGEEFAGIVNVHDLLYRPDDEPGELVRPAPRIPGRYGVDRALRRLRAERAPMGLVTGDGERVTGIVTVKDLVEEVSGELPVF